MLESARLLLLPWSRSAEAGFARPIVDPATQAPRGRVRCLGRRGSWLAWFKAYRLEVLETEDDSLLFTLVRPWGLLRIWDVYDADDTRVGSFYPPVLLDAEGQRRGYLQAEHGRQGAILGVAGQRLADFEIDTSQSLVVNFAANLDANPFLRMLILGSVLTLQPPPG
jgi:hypothetical protein